MLQPLVEQTVELVTHRAEQSGIHIEYHVPHDDVVGEVDDRQLRQVLLNLLLNALDASAEDHTIEVRMHQQRTGPDAPADQSAEPSVVIEVADSGLGLPLELGEKIFEPFVSTKDTGTGLGLPICRRIAADHGGTLTASSRPQGGAVFTLRIPLGPPPIPIRKEEPTGATAPP